MHYVWPLGSRGSMRAIGASAPRPAAQTWLLCENESLGVQVARDPEDQIETD